jgi:hypothetical protein
VCSSYGQECTSDASCCNGVPCSSSASNTPCMIGETGCTCHFLLQ